MSPFSVWLVLGPGDETEEGASSGSFQAKGKMDIGPKAEKGPAVQGNLVDRDKTDITDGISGDTSHPEPAHCLDGRCGRGGLRADS